MSAKISGKVWELDLDPMDKFVLLALADHADHDGNNIRPGNDLLCAKTGLSQQTISTKLAKFTEAGLLKPSSEKIGRGRKREFSIEPDVANRHPYFIERDARKVQVKRTFDDTQRYKETVPLEPERYKLTEQKVQVDSEKVQVDKILHDKERARVEPSIEPSIEPSYSSCAEAQPADQQPSAPADKPAQTQRTGDPLFLLFCDAFFRSYGLPYQHKQGDFVQMARLRKQCKMKAWEMTETRFRVGLDNYLASELGNHTLADLCARFSAFFKHPLDRYGKPTRVQSTIANQGNINARTETREERNNRYYLETIAQCVPGFAATAGSHADNSEGASMLLPAAD